MHEQQLKRTNTTNLNVLPDIKQQRTKKWEKSFHLPMKLNDTRIECSGYDKERARKNAFFTVYVLRARINNDVQNAFTNKRA